MSQVYFNEPTTKGRVLLKTNFGEILLELFSKEAPQACRNFIWLCLNRFYDNLIFFRIIKDFIVQTGDKNEFLSQRPKFQYERAEHRFEIEPHSRLRFGTRRGLIATAGNKQTGCDSQFFITLEKAEQLTGQHTIFGKVVGDSLYNVLKIGEVECDAHDRPISDAPYIISAEVLENPFPEIVGMEVINEILVLLPRIQEKFSKSIQKVALQYGSDSDEALIEKKATSIYGNEKPALKLANADNENTSQRAKLVALQARVNRIAPADSEKTNVEKDHVISEPMLQELPSIQSLAKEISPPISKESSSLTKMKEAYQVKMQKSQKNREQSAIKMLQNLQSSGKLHIEEKNAWMLSKFESLEPTKELPADPFRPREEIRDLSDPLNEFNKRQRLG